MVTTISKVAINTQQRNRLTARKLTIVLIALTVSLVVITSIALLVGSEKIPAMTILKIIVAGITGHTEAVAPEQSQIIFGIRLPRVLMGVVAGAALGVAGGAYQAILRNPLAEPYILGVSTGGAVGAIIAILFVQSNPLIRPMAGFLGAALTTAIVYFLGQGRRQAPTERLVLAGIITNTFLSSVVIFLITSVSGARMQNVFSWLMGHLEVEALLLTVVAIFVVTGIAIILINARSLNLIMTGEQEAMALGVEVERVKIMVYFASSLIAGATVAASGVIGFVGLIIPHAVRLVWGSDNRLVLPASALVGGAFLVLCDAIARTLIAPSGLHIGVITAMVGAPVFVYLLRRTS